MNESAIDLAYENLQKESQDVARALQALAGKLQFAISHGDTAAREWLLDLKGIALGVRAEQVQASELLNLIHSYLAEVHQQQPAQSQYRSMGQTASGGLSGLLGSRFGRAIETGAGFAVGEDLINHIL